MNFLRNLLQGKDLPANQASVIPPKGSQLSFHYCSTNSTAEGKCSKSTKACGQLVSRRDHPGNDENKRCAQNENEPIQEDNSDPKWLMNKEVETEEAIDKSYEEISGSEPSLQTGIAVIASSDISEYINYGDFPRNEVITSECIISTGDNMQQTTADQSSDIQLDEGLIDDQQTESLDPTYEYINKDNPSVGKIDLLMPENTDARSGDMLLISDHQDVINENVTKLEEINLNNENSVVQQSENNIDEGKNILEDVNGSIIGRNLVIPPFSEGECPNRENIQPSEREQKKSTMQQELLDEDDMQQSCDVGNNNDNRRHFTEVGNIENQYSNDDCNDAIFNQIVDTTICLPGDETFTCEFSNNIPNQAPSQVNDSEIDMLLTKQNLQHDYSFIQPPAAEAIALDPAAETIALDPAAETIALDPAAETTALDPAAETIALDPAAETTAMDPAAETIALDPAAETTALDLATETNSLDSAVETIALDPAAETIATKPAEETIECIPSLETTVIIHATETTALQPTTETIATKPVEGTIASNPLEGSIAQPKILPSAETIGIICAVEAVVVGPVPDTIVTPTVDTTVMKLGEEAISLDPTADTIAPNPAETDILSPENCATIDRKIIVTSSQPTIDSGYSNMEEGRVDKSDGINVGGKRTDYNLDSLDDSNFNPFQTRSHIRNSPPKSVGIGAHAVPEKIKCPPRNKKNRQSRNKKCSKNKQHKADDKPAKSSYSAKPIPDECRELEISTVNINSTNIANVQDTENDIFHCEIATVNDTALISCTQLGHTNTDYESNNYLERKSNPDVNIDITTLNNPIIVSSCVINDDTLNSFASKTPLQISDVPTNSPFEATDIASPNFNTNISAPIENDSNASIKNMAVTECDLCIPKSRDDNCPFQENVCKVLPNSSVDKNEFDNYSQSSTLRGKTAANTEEHVNENNNIVCKGHTCKQSDNGLNPVFNDDNSCSPNLSFISSDNISSTVRFDSHESSCGNGTNFNGGSVTDKMCMQLSSPVEMVQEDMLKWSIPPINDASLVETPESKSRAMANSHSFNHIVAMEAAFVAEELLRRLPLEENHSDNSDVAADNSISAGVNLTAINHSQMNQSEAGPEVATGLTPSDLQCASKFFRDAANLDNQLHRQLVTSMENHCKLEDDSGVQDSLNSSGENFCPKEERSAPEGTSSPDPKSLENSIVKGSVANDSILKGSEVNELLKKQEQRFEEKLLRRSLHLAEKENAMQSLLNHDKKESDDTATALKEATASRDALLKLVEQYKGMMSTLVADKEKQQRGSVENMKVLQTEKSQALEDLANVEAAFSDVHRKYERTKQIVESLKKNEETLKRAVSEYEDRLQRNDKKFVEMQRQTEEKIAMANEEFECQQKSNEHELTKMAALLKKAEMKIISLQESLDRNTRENQELTQLCDDLISKVGS